MSGGGGGKMKKKDIEDLKRKFKSAFYNKKLFLFTVSFC